MSAVTIYLCGTGKHRAQTDYLIGRLYELDGAEPWREAADGDGGQNGRKLVLDGPGAGGSHAIRMTKDAVAGTADPAALGTRGKLSGVISGSGWADNAHFAMQWLFAVDAESRRRVAPGAPITCVNMVGHSRGAVTATMIAHLIRQERPAWRANIFAIDPVPGGDASSFTTNTGMPGNPFVMPANVHAYTALLMEHVATGWNPKSAANANFQPVHLGQLRFEGDSLVRTFPMPGKHGDAVKTNFETYPLSKISAHLVTVWLRHYGTLIDPLYVRTNEQLLEDYAEVFLQRLAGGKKKAAAGAAWKSNPFRWGLGTQWVNDRARVIENPVREHPYYLNLHHASLFQLAFPEATARLDERQWVRSYEVAFKESQYPNSVQLLRDLKLVADDDLADRLEEMIKGYRSRTTGVKGFFSKQSDESTKAIEGLSELLTAYRERPVELEKSVIFLLHGRYSPPASGMTKLKDKSRLRTMLETTYTKWRSDWRVRVLG